MTDNTSFTAVYDSFLSKITDDMYMELFPDETNSLLQTLMLSALHWFEFPKVDIFDYNLNEEMFNIALSNEEINIIATYMVAEWVGQQLASVENTRMKYSGSDFKFTSQANHIGKLLALKEDSLNRGLHLQRLYKRRKKVNGVISSSFDQIMEV